MYTILICDDDRDIVSALDIYLTSEGYKTIKTYNGKEALRAVEENPVHLILMDVMMPELDGLSATRAIRGMDRPDARLPIIAMTANLFDEDVAACLAAGMDAHIPKPLEAGQMIRTIAEWLERKKQ